MKHGLGGVCMAVLYMTIHAAELTPIVFTMYGCAAPSLTSRAYVPLWASSPPTRQSTALSSPTLEVPTMDSAQPNSLTGKISS
jgi:hypothetical protein